MAEQKHPVAKPTRNPEDALRDVLPWKPVSATPEDIGALQALNRGEAQPHQQTRALGLILEICRNGGALYFPGGDDGRRNTDFALGRFFVGQTIDTLLRVKPRNPSSEQG